MRLTGSACLALVVIAGCMTGACGGQRAEPRTAPGDERDYRLEVQNQNFYSINVYLFLEGYRDRLGQVTGGQTETFAFDWPVEEVSILIDFVAGGGCIRTESLSVVEGDDLLLIVRATDDRRANRALCDD